MAEERAAARLQQPAGRRGKVAAALGRYYYDLLAALTDGVEQCPGEQTCATDGFWPVAQGRDLETYCRRGHCKHWPTKIEPGRTPAAAPAELLHLIDSADHLAQDAANGWGDLDRTEHTALEYDAYSVRCAAERRVQNRPRDEKTGKPLLTPDDPAFAPDGPPGDGAGIDW